jgi:hypothetical protein
MKSSPPHARGGRGGTASTSRPRVSKKIDLDLSEHVRRASDDGQENVEPRLRNLRHHRVRMKPVTFPRNLSPAVGWICAGLLLVPLGIALLWSSNPWVGAIMLVPGVPILGVNAWILIAKPPRLRIGPDGIWFGGGKTVPWREIKSAYLSTVRTNHARLTARAVSFDFHDAAKVRRMLPLPLRLRGVGAVGDLDLSENDFRTELAGVIAQITLAQADQQAAS